MTVRVPRPTSHVPVRSKVALPRTLPQLRHTRRLADEAGMTTAEYAVGTVAACGFAGILYRLLTSDQVAGLLGGVIRRALNGSF